MRSKTLKQRGVHEPRPTAASGESREMQPRSRSGRRLFVLDTNVLMHDPTAIFRFEEHDVYLPMVVLEELDAHKKGLSENSRNVRQVSRFLDDMMRGVTKEQIDRGLQLPSGYSGNHGKKPATGRLFFQTRQLGGGLPQALPGQGADNGILAQTLALQNEHPDARVILVSKDINLRIKAAVLGVHAEDYYSDKTLEDADVLTQTLETNRFVEIIMTRVTIPLGEDIGFLPGTEEEKMEPWMGALMDNLEVLTGSQEGGNWGRAATHDLLRNRIRIRSLNFMRGRTFLNRYLILDEAQNLTPKQMKALITRAGPGTKLACLGNIAQIDTPYLTEMTSGLTYAVISVR